MGKYALKPDQLRAVYRKLVETERLYEWEINERDGRTMEVDSPAASPTSSLTAISVVEPRSVVTNGDDSSADDARLPKEFFQDFSGVKIGKKIIEISPDFDTLSEEGSLSPQEPPPKDPSETVGVLKWGTRRGQRVPKKSQE